MKKSIKIISLLALITMLAIIVISCGTGVKFNNLIGGNTSGGNGGSGGSGGNQGFVLFFDGNFENDYESFSSIVPTSDGGYFIVGRAQDYTQNPAIDDALFVKLNQNLEVQWSKLGSIGIIGTFGFENIENGNNYYYACGYANNGFFISKLNSYGSTNTIIYFDNYVNFMLPHSTGIIANLNSNIGSESAGPGIAKFDYDLNNKWYITNIYWGQANTITSTNETVGYYKNTSTSGFLVKLNVSYNSFSNDLISQYASIYNNNSNDLYFLGSIKDDSNNFYFGFIDYRSGSDTYYLIKTGSNLEKSKEVSFSGDFNVSLVPVPNSNNVILGLYDKNNNYLVLVKLDSNLDVNTASQVKISNFNSYNPNHNIMYFTPLTNYFLVPGTYSNNGLIYTFDYNLNPACGSPSSSNLILQNTNYFNIDTTPISTPALQSGSITVNIQNTDTTDYQLTTMNACPIN